MALNQPYFVETTLTSCEDTCFQKLALLFVLPSVLRACVCSIMKMIFETMGLNSFGVEIPLACSKEELVDLLQIAWQRNRDPDKEPQGWKKLVSFYRRLTSGDSSDSDSEWDGEDEDRSSTPLDVDEEDSRVPLDGPLADQLSCVSLSKAPEPEKNRTGVNCVDPPEISEFDTGNLEPKNSNFSELFS